MRYFVRDMFPGSEKYNRMLELYHDGLSYGKIANHPDIQKERTTIMHHIRRLGFPARRRGYVPTLKREHAVLHWKSKEELAKHGAVSFGKGHCQECGIILAYAPDHKCGAGTFISSRPDNLYGNSVE